MMGTSDQEMDCHWKDSLLQFPRVGAHYATPHETTGKSSRVGHEKEGARKMRGLELLLWLLQEGTSEVGLVSWAS